MRVMVIVKATSESETGKLPSDDAFNEMNQFNEELVKAGVLLAADGLQPSKKGKRLRLSSRGAPTVIDGPFTESKELVAGFWLWEVKSMEEAVEWAKRIPTSKPGQAGCEEIEIRPLFEASDFSPAVQARLGHWREAIARR